MSRRFRRVLCTRRRRPVTEKRPASALGTVTSQECGYRATVCTTTFVVRVYNYLVLTI